MHNPRRHSSQLWVMRINFIPTNSDSIDPAGSSSDSQYIKVVTYTVWYLIQTQKQIMFAVVSDLFVSLWCLMPVRLTHNISDLHCGILN